MPDGTGPVAILTSWCGGNTGTRATGYRRQTKENIVSREQDRLFTRNLIAVLAALVGVTLVLIIAVNIAFDEGRQGPTAVERERAAQRLAPVGQVRVAPIQAQQPPAAPAAGSAASAEPPAQPPSPEQTTTQPGQASPAASGDAAADAAAAEPSADSATPADGSQRQPDTSTAADAAPAEAADDTSESGAGGNGGAEQTPAEPAGEGAAQPAPEASAPTAPPTEDLAAGRALAEGMCNVCHANRFLNSPQLGDRTAWKPRLKRDLATMVRHVQEGYGNMPPQGAFGTREEIRKAILWMVEEETGLEVQR